MRWRMKSSDMIRKLCMIENISISELARRIGQTPQNFNKKLKRDTVTFDEMLDIAAVLGASYEQAVLDGGKRIQIGSTEV